jgi:Cysteine dioxygenase type I
MTLLEPVPVPPPVAPPVVKPAVSTRALASIAAAIGRAVPIGLLGDQPARRWALVEETPEYQAWIIAWPPGTGLDLHDHDGASAGVYVVAGRLHERYVGADGELHRRWWRPHDQYELAADHVHEVHNVDLAEAVTIHVYSPGLRDVRFRIERSWSPG